MKAANLRWEESACATCGCFLHVRTDIPKPHYCAEHEGGQTMSKKPKKDFSEAVAASNGHTAENGAPVHVPVERRRYKETLPVKIDEATVAGKARDMAACFETQAAIEEERRTAMAGFKERLSGVKDRMAEYAASIREHTELREVEVIESLVVETNEVIVMRADTGEIVERRGADAGDVQEAMFPPDADSPENLLDGPGEPPDPSCTTGANPKPVDATPS